MSKYLHGLERKATEEVRPVVAWIRVANGRKPKPRLRQFFAMRNVLFWLPVYAFLRVLSNGFLMEERLSAGGCMAFGEFSGLMAAEILCPLQQHRITEYRIGAYSASHTGLPGISANVLRNIVPTWQVCCRILLQCRQPTFLL